MRRILLPLLLVASFASAAEPLLPDTAETPRMKDWREMKYGMVLHFGMSAFTDNEFDPGDQPSTTYASETIDGELVLYCEHIQTVKYRHPENFTSK